MNTIAPLSRGKFGSAASIMQQWAAEVPASLTNEQLTDPALWVNLAPSVRPRATIQVTAEDDSFAALLFVTFAHGNHIRTKVIWRAELEEVDYDALLSQTGDYEVKMRGVRKWCIVQKSTGAVYKENIPTQAKALAELDEYLQALAR